MDYPKTMAEIVEKVRSVSRLHEEIETLSEQLNLGENDLGINLYGKLVIGDNDSETVYRIEQNDEVIKRIELKKIAEGMGFGELFVEETIIEDTGFFTISRQPMLKVLDKKILSSFEVCDISIDHLAPNTDESKRITWKIFNDFPAARERIIALFDDFKLGWFGKNNCGIAKNGKISIFDFTGRFSINGKKDRIIFYRGGEQHEINIR